MSENYLRSYKKDFYLLVMVGWVPQWMKCRHTKDERRVPVNYESFVMRDNGSFLYEDRDRWRVFSSYGIGPWMD